MAEPGTGTSRAVEVLHDRGPAAPVGMDQWTAGSGYLIGGRLVLTAAHNVDYRQELGDEGQLLVRDIRGSEFAAWVVLACDEPSGVDLALLEITDTSFDDHLPPVSFAQVDRDSPAPVPGCWAVGFPQFGEAGPVLPGGSRRETWQVRGDILPGTKLRAGLVVLQVTSTPRPVPDSLAGSEWEGMSGAVVFATDLGLGELAVGVITVHHRPEGESALTVVPVTALARTPAAGEWWRQLGVADPGALPVQPQLSVAGQRRSRLAGQRALSEHWDPRGRGVERAARPGWFFTGRRQALSQLVAWLAAAPDPEDNVRVVTGGPGSGKSAVLARLVTMSDPHYRTRLPEPLAADDPVADLPSGAIDVAVHARTAPADEVVSALAAAAGARQADLGDLIDRLLERPGAFTIAVDALDEADDPPVLAQALRRLASETADTGVRLLVGTRPGGPDRRLVTALGLPARDDGPALIDLDNPAYLSRDDLAEYVRRRLLLTGVPPAPGRPDTPYRSREALANQVADAVAQAAYPAFLIAQLVSRALLLRGQPISPHDPGWQQFPKSVDDAMDQYLASVGNQAKQERVEDLLRPLAYARGDGLPLDDAGLWPRLATALARPGRSYTGSDVATLLDTTADYLVETVVTGEAAYYRLYHEALSERLRERDQQRPRPVSVAQSIYRCLLDTVTVRADGSLDWPAAHPYLHSQLAGHAADAGQLTSLLDDPEFLVAADPAGLSAALQRPGRPPAFNDQIYWDAYLRLLPGADLAGERASYLQLAARRHRARLAEQLDQLPLHQPWTARWVRGQLPHPHYVVGRHLDSAVFAVALEERYGRPVIISSGKDGVRVWDLDSGEPVFRLAASWDVAVGERQGRPVIISACRDDYSVRVWDLDSGEPALAPLTGHDGGVSAVAVGERHGRPVIVSGGWDGTVRVWDLDSGEPVLGPLAGHAGPVGAVTVGMRQGRQVIVSGGSDHTVRVWDMDSGEPALGPLTYDDWVSAVAVGVRHGRPVIVSSGHGPVRVWDMDSGEPALGPLTHGINVNGLAADEWHGRPVIVSGSSDGTVRVWDLDSGEPARGPLTGQNLGWDSVAVGMRHRRPVVISGGSDGTVQVWDLDSDEPARGPSTGHDGPVGAVAVGMRHGRPVVVSGGDDQTVRVWDLGSGEPVLGPLAGHAGPVGAVTVGMRHGRPVIVSSGEWGGDEAMRVWDMESGEPVLGPLTGHRGGVRAVALEERYGRPVIVSGGGDGALRVWDLESGEPAVTLVEPDPAWQGRFPGLGAVRTQCAVAAGVRHGRPVIVSGGGPHTLQVWDLESDEPVLGPLIGHDGPVRAVAVGVHHGRPVIASGSDDRTVRVWDLDAEGNPTLRIELQYPVLSLAPTANGLAIGTSTELLRVDLLYQLEPAVGGAANP